MVRIAKRRRGSPSSIGIAWLIGIIWGVSAAYGQESPLTEADIAAAFGETAKSDPDWQGELEEITDERQEQDFRFRLPYGRDPFVPIAPRIASDEPQAPAGAFVSSAFQLKGTWRQLGGVWHAILQDVSGEPVVVSAGDRIGEADVLSITEDAVTLRWPDVTPQGKAQFRQVTLSL